MDADREADVLVGDDCLLALACSQTTSCEAADLLTKVTVHKPYKC